MAITGAAESGGAEDIKCSAFVTEETPKEKLGSFDDADGSKLKHEALDNINELPGSDDSSDETSSDNIIIRTGADVSQHLLPLRDDGDPALTFRGIFLATVLSAFQAVMNQIYTFKPTSVNISGTFLVLIAYFLGKAWASLLPRGDLLAAKWRRDHGSEARLPLLTRIACFLNHGEWGLKEHAICAITANSASNASTSCLIFAAQELFYDLPVSATTVILGTISIGTFGYGLAGILRPICVWHVESVYWSALPTVKTLQGLHWQEVKNSKPLRWFWYAFAGMSIYEFFPAYIFPWLNSVSIPSLAAMNAVGSKAATLTNLFGGATNNEGLGILSLSFDWQYITSSQTAVPLRLQLHQICGVLIAYAAMLGIYYSNVWGALTQPFMSTRLRSIDGTPYPVAKVFASGLLDESALAKYGPPRLTGSFVFALFIANAATGAMVAYCIFFWGRDIVNTFKNAKKGIFNDRHHQHMAKHYKEAPWTWYVAVLITAFVLGLVVCVRENIGLPGWAYVIALLLGCILAPLTTLLFARFGNSVSTANLSKMIAGLLIPGRPVGNMYFGAFSHNMMGLTLTLCNDLKMGEYLKIPSRAMFLTQMYGTILGGFINYAVMASVIDNKRDLLVNSSGNSAWSGALLQGFSTTSASWSMTKYLYKSGEPYAIVPYGVVLGFGIVMIHRLIVYIKPQVWSFSLNEINTPMLLYFIGYIPIYQSQTCIILSQVLAGLFVQYYLRNYRPRIFKDYSYLVTSAFDGASLTVLFILSFAVFGAGGPQTPFPTWWGNNVSGNYDHCPAAE